MATGPGADRSGPAHSSEYPPREVFGTGSPAVADCTALTPPTETTRAATRPQAPEISCCSRHLPSLCAAVGYSAVMCEREHTSRRRICTTETPSRLGDHQVPAEDQPAAPRRPEPGAAADGGTEVDQLTARCRPGRPAQPARRAVGSGFSTSTHRTPSADQRVRGSFGVQGVRHRGRPRVLPRQHLVARARSGRRRAPPRAAGEARDRGWPVRRSSRSADSCPATGARPRHRPDRRRPRRPRPATRRGTTPASGRP